jgi:hypothetical protein
MRYLALMLLTLLCSSALAFAASVTEAELDVKYGNYPAALNILLPLANQGNAIAQTYLGTMYLKGMAGGTNIDADQGLSWLTKAAAQDEAHAESEIGAMYYLGWGVSQDEAVALKWLTKAGNQGITEAQIMLADLYAKGGGKVHQDYQEAYYWRSLYLIVSCDEALCHDLRQHLTSDQILIVDKRVQQYKEIAAKSSNVGEGSQLNALTEHDIVLLKLQDAPLPDWVRDMIIKQSGSKNPDKIEVVEYKGRREFQISHGEEEELLNEDGKRVCRWGGESPQLISGQCDFTAVHFIRYITK